MLREGEYVCTSQEMDNLSESWTKYWIKDYYCTRWQWTYKQYMELNWEIYDKNVQTLPITEQRYVVKLLTQWLPVGHNLQKYGGLKQNCPYCNEYKTVYHVYHFFKSG